MSFGLCYQMIQKARTTMIWITGDCHAEFNRFSTKRFPAQKEMTKDDFVIICGDFAGIWDYKISSNEVTHLLNK